jgi:hypothetical protein
MRRWRPAVAVVALIGLVAVSADRYGHPHGVSAAPSINGCPMFPADNVWNTPITNLPLDSRSEAYKSSIGLNAGMHPDFGTVWQGAPIGIPYTTVPSNQPGVAITFDIDDESDPGPYPIPPNPPIEGGPDSNGDRHVLVVQGGTCKLYETWSSYPQQNGTWFAGSGAIFDLTSNDLRPDTWTSADAAGLPILPGLVRYDEVASGAITHALRFTAPVTQRAYVWPARHYASSNTNPNVPPMGQRFRLRSNFDMSGFSPHNRVILQALKTYGMFLADNGSSWYLSGVPDPRWDDDDLHELQDDVHGYDFEAVDESSLMVDPDSGQVATGSGTPTPTATPAFFVTMSPTHYACVMRGGCVTPAPTASLPSGPTVTATTSATRTAVVTTSTPGCSRGGCGPPAATPTATPAAGGCRRC